MRKFEDKARELLPLQHPYYHVLVSVAACLDVYTGDIQYAHASEVAQHHDRATGAVDVVRGLHFDAQNDAVKAFLTDSLAVVKATRPVREQVEA